MKIPNISRTAGRAALKLKKHSPTLLFVGGLVGFSGTVALTARATLKANEVHSNLKDQMVELDLDQEITPEEHKKAVVSAQRHAVVTYVKLYAPVAVVGVASIAALTKSHQILNGRYIAAAASYAGLDRAFKEYRERVVTELGEEKDLHFRHGSTEVEIIDGYDKTGKEIIGRKDKFTGYKVGEGETRRFFDDTNDFWEKDPLYNYNFLHNREKAMNLLLQKRGFLFLNEVLSALGFPYTPEGQQLGWIYGFDSEGDGYVDFGFHKFPDFCKGNELDVWLDFNVDGLILDKI